VNAPQRMPVYLQVRRHIMDLLGEGGEAGTRIPSERMLADTLGASRMTVRKAVEQLVLEGVLERDGTSGTRVAERVVRPIDNARLQGLSQIIDRGGARPGSSLLSFTTGKAGRKIASRLRLKPSEPIVSLRRLRSANRRPFCIETTHFPAHLVPGLKEGDLIGDQSLGTLMSLRYGVAGARVDRLVRVEPADAEDARLLDLSPPGLALIQVMLVWDRLDQPIEYTVSVNDPRRVILKTADASADL